MWKGNLLSAGSNAKTIKGDGAEYVTAIMYLTPWNGSGVNLCPTAGLAKCHEGCLNTAGRGQMDGVQKGRLRKAQWFSTDRAAFMLQLAHDIASFLRFCEKRKVQAVVRLNGTSDIRWELIPVAGYANIMAAFPSVQFYDYTKIGNRKGLPFNYHLTFSYSGVEAYQGQVQKAVDHGMNIAVVFRHKGNIPASFLGLCVVDGDKDDMRFLDPEGVVVALYAKGKAKKDYSGFVVG
jgi:hypothetical protein